MKKNEYLVPEIEVVKLYTEGSACQVNASGEIEGGEGD